MIVGISSKLYLSAMKACLLLLLVSLHLKIEAQEPAKLIRTLLENQSQAWNRGDLEGFMEGYWKNDSLRFIGKSGITYGWRQT
jgi:hypothetical protein